MSAPRFIVLPLLIIALGVGWLLTTHGIGLSIDWVWTLSLAFVGILVMALNGLDKVSVVIGPFFLIGSICSILRQRKIITLDTEVPVLVILIGVLLLIARIPAIPVPRWVIEGKEPPKKE